ncbi:hypothetical protein DSM112329_01989 [Paraconexibacter sp. AEG42_29]|uniref:Bacterial Ig-like domain-containing protein n=1 Tax=Paraconexibacter sp. AEG42_29 TaxID=2997339 RepID=A0AAU7ATW9_9ACTN
MHARVRAATAVTVLVAGVSALGPPASASAAGPSLRAEPGALRFTDADVRGATRTVAGELVEVADDAAQRYFVETATGHLAPVDFGGATLPARARGATVRAEATPGGDVRSATLTTVSRAAPAPGPHRAYVARVDDRGDLGADDTAVKATVDAALTRWREESNGAITAFTRADFKPFSTTSDCKSGSAMFNEAATSLYSDVSFGSTSGNHLIVIGAPSCSGGVGTVGSGIGSGGRLSVNWAPTKNLTTLLHELGHNLSLGHAHACYPAGPNCTVNDYGNYYGFMGVSIVRDPPFTPAALDSFERARLGIADPDEITTVALPDGQRTRSSTYDLRARGTGSGLRGLRVTDPVTGTAYSVDWRSGGGRDALSYYASTLATYQTQFYNPGVTVAAVDSDGRTATLQAHAKPNPADGDVFGLVGGRTFTAGGMTISVASVGDKADPAATSRVGVTLTDSSVAPDTAISSGPAAGATVTTGTVGFAFAAVPADAGTGFDCRLDEGAWSACTSPRQLTGLADGPHSFAVRARDSGGRVDATPATRSFTIAPAPAPSPTQTTSTPSPTPTTTPTPTVPSGSGTSAGTGGSGTTSSPPAATPSGPSSPTGGTMTPTPTFAPTPAPAPSGAPTPSGVPTPGAAAPASLLVRPPIAQLGPAKLEVASVRIAGAGRRLTLLAPISARASGTVRVTFQTAGVTTSFVARIDAVRRRIAVDRALSAAQGRAGSGILTLTYGGDADTQPQTVRLRVARRSSGLRAGRPTIVGARLRAAGTVSPRARGSVRVQLLFEPAGGATRTLTFSAPIAGGRYRLDAALSADVQAAIAGRRGVVHSYTLFTGDVGRRIQGALASFQVLGERA